MQRTFIFLSLILALLSTTLLSCDAMVYITYSVQNKKKNAVQLFVPAYALDPSVGVFGPVTDTVLILKPNEKVIVGSGSKIDFPWGAKNIYRKSPGFCGMVNIETDTAYEIGCSRREWRYWRRNSNYRIR